MRIPDGDAGRLDEGALRKAINAGEDVESAGRRLWRYAASLSVWRTCGVLWDRSPWWYLREWPGLVEASAALHWVRRGGPWERTEAGWALVELVAKVDKAVEREWRKLNGG